MRREKEKGEEEKFMGEGEAGSTDEKVRAGYVIILGFKLKHCSFDFFLKFFNFFFKADTKTT